MDLHSLGNLCYHPVSAARREVSITLLMGYESCDASTIQNIRY
jgi:hypothetical protein